MIRPWAEAVGLNRTHARAPSNSTASIESFSQQRRRGRWRSGIRWLGDAAAPAAPAAHHAAPAPRQPMTLDDVLALPPEPAVRVLEPVVERTPLSASPVLGPLVRAVRLASDVTLLTLAAPIIGAWALWRRFKGS